MLLKKGDKFLISDCSHIQEIRLFLGQNRNANIRLDELYSLYVYLNASQYSEYISFPLDILKWESPDFVLNQHIGIEVVTSATQKEKHAWHKMKTKYPKKSVLDTSCYIPGSNAKVEDGIISPDEKGEITLNSSGLGDYGKEKAWLDCICHSMCKKTCLLNEEEFSKHQNNQLIIYDDTPYFPDLDYVVTHLQRNYKCSNKYQFDHIHIIKNVMNIFIVDVFGETNRISVPLV